MDQNEAWGRKIVRCWLDSSGSRQGPVNMIMNLQVLHMVGNLTEWLPASHKGFHSMYSVYQPATGP